MNKSSFLLLLVVFSSLQAGTVLTKRLSIPHGKDGTVYITSGVVKNIVIQRGYGGQVIINEGLRVREGSRGAAKLGSERNPARSCKAILEKDWSAPSGMYYLRTGLNITKVYCYMENIPGCGGGGWTTIMKTDGHKSTFRYASPLWQNKVPYHVTGGQSGVDDQETKLPTYWTMPFTSLCLGMKTRAQTKPNWIRLNYRAGSLYSVISGEQNRSFSIGRRTWKSLVPASSLQRNCNKEGFNNAPVASHSKVRIGIVSNEQNDCNSPDSFIGFGSDGKSCSGDSSITSGNAAGCGPDNGRKTIKTYGYILAQ